ncbi:MAG: NAD(P)/FAD-dependent oxidoreductase [Spirochaetia bacterium]
MREFDVCVIGTGTAGETAIAELLRLDEGLRIVVADERPYGGTCALRGCQPKKFLVVPSHAALEARALTERGFRSAPVLDWPVMQESLRTFTDAVPGSTKEGLETKGVVCLSGHCEFLSLHEVKCGEEKIRADSFVIAAGARPRPLPIPGAEHTISSDEFLYLEELPERIVFIGGGYISMEFAYVASAVGSSVTVLQRGNRIMERFDADMVAILEDACSTKGIDIRTKVNPVEIRKNDKGDYSVLLEGGNTVDADLVVGAIGRVPNIENLGLEKAGISYDKRGIETDDFMRTSQKHIYAIGDCVQGIQLSPVSDLEAGTAARNMVKPESATVDLSTLPSVVFSYPQLSAVGMDEERAKQKGNVRLVQGSGAGWPNYQRLNESHVGYKVLIDKDTETLLGAHLIGPYAGELINLFALAIKKKIPVAELKELPWAYPTYSADIKYMLG